MGTHDEASARLEWGSNTGNIHTHVYTGMRGIQVSASVNYAADAL
jgi:hypothetical protein